MNGNFFDTNSKCSTLVELLRRRALRHPGKLAYTFLVDGEREEVGLTYAELDRRARAIGAVVQGSGAVGDRVLLLYPQGVEYIAAFLGCLYAGRIAVPTYPPRLNRLDSRLQAIVTDSQATLALTSTRILSSVERRFDHMPNLKALRWLDTSIVSNDGAKDWRDPMTESDALAFLQYTSGSTATPKGVMVRHGNLLYNLEMLRMGFDQSEQSVFVSWLPLFHDMGLIVMALQSLYVGASCVLMSPADFLQRPFRWLWAISRYRGTTSGGPNFAYELSVRKISAEERGGLDLSSWTLAVNGAEPVRYQTLDRFAEAFEPCGFRREALYPAYGLAEATVFVSGGVKANLPVVRSFEGTALGQNRIVETSAESEDSQALVGCGRAWLDQRIAIVDPESLTLSTPGQVGEIWVSGPNVAQGYWDRSEETDQTFGAHLADTGEGPFLRTGDLGFSLDGELYITGRIKDLIIVRGLNHYPQDIELTVERSHPALRPGCGAAFSVDVGGEERLALVYEVKRECRDVDVPEVCSAVRRAVAKEHELQVYAVVLIRPGSVPKTSSGKIQRRACRARFLEGNLKVIGSSVLEDDSRSAWGEDDLTRDALLAVEVKERRPVLESCLRDRVAQVLRVPSSQLDVQRPLVALGIDSLMAFELQAYVETHLGVTVSAVDLIEDLSVEQLATQVLTRLATTAATAATPCATGQQVGQGHLPPPIEPVPREGELPLSFEQERLWLLDRLVAPGNPAYHITTAVRLTGHLDVAVLEQSLTRIVQRHEVLRTAFPAVDGGQPVPAIAPALTLSVTTTDLSTFPHTEREAEIQRLSTREAQRPFDLARAPLMRVSLLRLGGEEHVLIFTMHHIISDAWSMNVLVWEMAALYRALSNGASPSLPELPIQYVDFAHWQRQWMREEVLEAHLSYWEEQLAEAPTEPLLPTDRSRPDVQSFRGGHKFFDLSPALVASLRELCRREGITPFMALLAAFKAALHCYTGRDDVCVGSPTRGRIRPETERLVGFFAYPLVLRTRLSGDFTFRELLARVRDTALGAYAHQNVPLSKVTGMARHGRSAGHNPLFQVMFGLTKAPIEGIEMPDLALDLVDVESGATDFDLFITLMENGEALHGVLGYNVDLFDADTIESLLTFYREILETSVRQPETRLSRFELPPELQAKVTAARVSEREQTIAITSTFTAEPVERALAYWMQELDIPSTIEFAPYNQVFQQLLDPSGLLAENDLGVNVVLVRFEDWLRFADVSVAGTISSAGARERIEQNVRDLVLALKSAAGRSGNLHLVCLCPAAPATLADPDCAAFLQRMEALLSSEMETTGGVCVVTTAELNARYPVAEYHDPYSDRLGHIPYTTDFFVALGTMIARRIYVSQATPRKVIVLDCDQTLWRGVCGEDGPLGVEIDPPRKALQEFMIAQHDAGMLICLCSKNSEKDVIKVFDHHPEMILRRDHVVSWRINWRPKSENLASLTEELGLGLDSFIFLDDNPVECAEVQANCPEILTLQLPQEADSIPRFLDHVWVFDHVKVTGEDRKRTALYRQNTERERLKRESLTFDDFLASLELEVDISPLTVHHLPRVAQLTQRTNQFNCTTIRRTEGEIQQLCLSGEMECLVVQVRDRFGDYGLVGAIIFKPVADAIDVDTFLLSCRVLGRGVEHRMLARLGEIARARGLGYVDVECIPTQRNKPALDFLDGVEADSRRTCTTGYRFRFPVETVASLTYMENHFSILDDNRVLS
jgi:FkbH-like protein